MTSKLSISVVKIIFEELSRRIIYFFLLHYFFFFNFLTSHIPCVLCIITELADTVSTEHDVSGYFHDTNNNLNFEFKPSLVDFFQAIKR